MARGAADGRPKAIRFAAIRTDGDALIEISDTGPGFPADQSERIFEPFHKSTSEVGAGLGLSIAADLVARNGGSIELAPAKADDFYCGARFLITLPTPGEQRARGAAAGARPTPDTERPSGGFRTRPRSVKTSHARGADAAEASGGRQDHVHRRSQSPRGSRTIAFLSSGAREADEALKSLVGLYGNVAARGGRRHRRPRRRRPDAADAASHDERAQADLRHEPRLGRLPDERIFRARACGTGSRRRCRRSSIRC